MLKIARYSSSLAKLWVQHNGTQAIKVSTTGCKDVSDLTEAIKKALPRLSAFPSNNISLHRSLNDPAIRPGLSIADLYKSNTDIKPLIVKHHIDLFEFLSKEKEIESKEKEIESKEKEIEWQKERVIEILKQKEQETLYKLHYQQLLTVRGLIEMYEKNFGEPLLKRNLSRLEKWKVYLQSRKENFQPFKEAGFSVDQVGNHVDMIFKSHSADIHSVKAVEGLILKAKGNLTHDQMKVVLILVEFSPWKDLLTIT